MSNMTNETDLSFEYVCKDSTDLTCPNECVTLEACLDCECQVALLEDTGGPWGQVMDFLFCLLPIIYLVVVTIKPNPTPTTVSLPASAAIMFLVRLMYLGSNPLLTASCVILGFHEALTPLSIMAGAIMLFETMEATKCLPYMMREMKALTAGHPIAECMLLFNFAYMIEGASGFGTPVALGAPMLVSTGHPALESVVLLLVFNTFATVWGAVGTPLWFGFGGLGLTEDELTEISFKAGVAMVVSAFLLIPFILTVLVPFAFVRKNMIFLLSSITGVMGPVVGLASVNYEFPALIGGMVGCLMTALLIKFKVGLSLYDPDVDGREAQTSVAAASNNNNTGSRLQVSDLTEIDVSKSVLKPAPVQTNEADNNGSKPEEPNAESSAQPRTKLASSLNGHWNVEVERDNKEEEEETTVVFVAPSNSDAAEDTSNKGGVEMLVSDGAEKTKENENEGIPEPPLVEESGRDSRHQHTDGENNLKMSALEKSLNADNELLGPRKTLAEGYMSETLLRTFPIWAVVLLLVLTRVGAIGIKPYLTKQDPYFAIDFGTYGEFRLTASVVFQLLDIMTYPGISWKYELLYVPFLIPFVTISVATMIIYRKDLTCRPLDIVKTVMSRLSNPAIALLGALTLVQLMIKRGPESPAYLLGVILADWLQEAFVVVSPLLGALGSFFSGSTTVSDLTFGEIQAIAARAIGVEVTSMLALQAYGASAGNGICLNNIISALTVVGLDVSEGEILKRTGKFVFASTTIATGVMLALFFRFE